MMVPSEVPKPDASVSVASVSMASMPVAAMPVAAKFLTAFLMAWLIVGTAATTAGADTRLGDDVGPPIGAEGLSTVESSATEPGVTANSTSPLSLPAGRALIRTARAFLWPGLVTVALMVGFGLAGRMTSSRQSSQPKLDDDLRSFS